MSTVFSRPSATRLIAVAAAWLVWATAGAQTDATTGARSYPAPADWPAINRDAAATRYSPLTEIHTGNVGGLAEAWTYELGGNSTAVPIVVDGRMYLPSGDRVVAASRIGPATAAAGRAWCS
jgi:glucose dehydrogenase